jgi:hypothetical protein
MKEMNANDARSINQQLFEQMTRFECEASAGTRSYIPCGKPATKVIEWRHQDGDIEHRVLCEEHAVVQQRSWSEMDWDTRVEVSDIEEWQLGIRYAGRTAIRVGSRFRDAAA